MHHVKFCHSQLKWTLDFGLQEKKTDDSDPIMGVEGSHVSKEECRVTLPQNFKLSFNREYYGFHVSSNLFKIIVE